MPCVRRRASDRRPASFLASPKKPVGFVGGLVRYRHIIRQFTRREVLGRYRGSYMGDFLVVLQPAAAPGDLHGGLQDHLLDAKFTNIPNEGSFDFALMLFAGLIIYNLFAECLNRAPNAHPDERQLRDEDGLSRSKSCPSPSCSPP